MALVKTTYAGLDTVTLTSGAGWSQTTAIDLRGSYGAIACMKLTNASGTAGAQGLIGVEIGADEDNDGDADRWYWYGGAWGVGVSSGATGAVAFELPFGIEWVRFATLAPTTINATAEGWIVSIEEM